MTYSDFTLELAIIKFSLLIKSKKLFSNLENILVSNWLEKSLSIGKTIALTSGNEKARSEFLIAPVMIEIEDIFKDKIAIYSGKNLDVDKQNGLSGECDFLISKGEQTILIQAPIIAIVEAKKADIDTGLGQCVAQMVGAKLVNEKQGNYYNIYGCVTTGEDWLFIKLEDKIVWIDSDRYYINEIGKIMGCFCEIVRSFIKE